MTIDSISFILLIPFIVVVNYIIPKQFRYIWVAIVSLLSYAFLNRIFLIGFMVCLLLTYLAGIAAEKSSEKGKRAMIIGVILFHITSLVVFRYVGALEKWVPIGASFYTLQAIGYLVDVYRKKANPERNIIRMVAFMAFFPTVISGPIERSGNLLRQLREGTSFDEKRIRKGLYCLMGGYMLKHFIADQLGRLVDYGFNSVDEITGAALLWAVLLYAIQLYADFSGYSLLAIGAGKLLGYDILENFKQPYFSHSIKEFWQRWHITLSAFLKDYVYIPLGGNRKGIIRKDINLLVTFLVSGIWHGAGLNFIFWGFLHGMYQIAENHLKLAQKLEKNKLGKLIGIIISFVLVDFAWLFFRAESLSQAFSIIKKIATQFNVKETTYYGYYLLGTDKRTLLAVLACIVVFFVIELLHEKNIYLVEALNKKVLTPLRWIIYIAVSLAMILLLIKDYGQVASTFIYARF